MKNFKKTLALALATAVSVSTVFVVSPAEAKAASSKFEESVTLSTKSAKATTVKYVKGQSFTLNVTKSKKAVAASKLTFTTGNKKVATVSKKGVVTIKAKKGTATITVKDKTNKKYKATIKVTAKKSLATSKLVLSKKSATIKVGNSVTLKAAQTPINTTDSVTWKSSNSKIAKVSKSGKVTGVAGGTVTITATSGKKTATATIKVDATSLKITGDSSVKVGKKITLKSTVKPTGSAVTWTSSDTKVATVSKGVVKGIKVGTVTITAKSGTTKKTKKITVNPKSLSVTGASSVTVGSSITLKATVDPTDSAVKWTSSDTKIATVSNKGKVKGVKAGTVTITVKSGKTTKTKKITVKAKATTVAVSKVTTSPTTWNATKIGATTKVKATVDPSNATNKTVEWTSSNTNVVTVSKASVTSGTEITLTAKGLGTATVTATSAADKNKKATIEVTVTENALTTNDTTYTYNLTKAYTVTLDNKTAAFGVAQDELAADVATLKEETNKTWTAEGLKNLLSGIASKGSKSAWLKVISLADSKYSTIGSLLKTDIAFDGTDKLTAGKIEFRAIALQAESETAHTVSYDLYENGTKVGSRVVTIAKDAKSITIKEGNALLFSFTETSTGHTFVIDKTAYSRLVTDGVIDDYVANATVTNTAK